MESFRRDRFWWHLGVSPSRTQKQAYILSRGRLLCDISHADRCVDVVVAAFQSPLYVISIQWLGARTLPVNEAGEEVLEVWGENKIHKIAICVHGRSNGVEKCGEIACSAPATLGCWGLSIGLTAWFRQHLQSAANQVWVTGVQGECKGEIVLTHRPWLKLGQAGGQK